MLMRKFAATSALLIAAMGVAAGTAHAEEAPAAAAPINYTAEIVEDSKAVVTTDAGSMVVEDNVLKIKAADGTVVAGTPLAFRIEEHELPIVAEISGNTATLTPVMDPAKAVYKPVALPYEAQAPWKSEYDREVAAFNRLKDTISVGATMGALVGGLGGAAVGCIAGAGAGLVLTGALLALFGAGPLAGCIAGAAAVGFLGVLAGQLFITAPVAIGAAIQYFATVTSPFTPPAK
ncbi:MULTISPECIES: hypothetical protein [Nocardia]|uniref:hypothetical protein n=1 Tax=Nocardia TaxID=1817 RepID=UPI0015EED619|nr:MULTISPECIES: hypothetical protein [Nocardia]MCA2209254.1 hypothetical protein [Nocardia rosealba]